MTGEGMRCNDHMEEQRAPKGRIAMGMFEFFRKKAANKARSCSAETVSAEAVPANKPAYSTMRGGFSGVDSEYRAIGSVISELEQAGFLLNGINTSGEDSGHDWTVAYRKSYSSFEAFCAKAMTDYQEACLAQPSGSPQLDWDSTGFTLTNQRLFVRLFALNSGAPDHKIDRAGWALRVPEDMDAEDALIVRTLDILKKYE